MTEEQESKGTQPERDRTLEDDVKMGILAAAEATHGSRPGSGTVLDEEELKPGQAPLDINTAAVYQLANMPGIGPALARAIVDYRENVRPFEEVSDLAAVPGVSRDTYDQIAGRVKVERGEGDRPLVIGYDEPVPDEDAPGDVDIELWDPEQGQDQ